MRARDVVPGWYSAHRSGYIDIEVLKVERVGDWQVRITFRMTGSATRTQVTDVNREWSLQPVWEFKPYIIQELTLV